MNEPLRLEDMAKKTIVYKIAEMDDVIVKRDIEYTTTENGSLTMDIYYPSDANNGKLLPVVIFALGYPGAGYRKMWRCKETEMGSYVSWAKLVAASGMAAITYSIDEPVADLDALVRYVRENASELGIDRNRLALWACSGNVPTALSLLMQPDSDSLKCAVFCYGAMLDLDGSTGIAESSEAWGFANPSAGRSVEEISIDVPLFIARAGRDQIPGLNDSIDRFVVHAVRRNLPITFVNHAKGPHWFDVLDDSETSRQIIREIVAFMRFHLIDVFDPS
jgi:acetyl esterase/lipase